MSFVVISAFGALRSLAQHCSFRLLSLGFSFRDSAFARFSHFLRFVPYAFDSGIFLLCEVRKGENIERPIHFHKCKLIRGDAEYSKNMINRLCMSHILHHLVVELKNHSLPFTL